MWLENLPEPFSASKVPDFAAAHKEHDDALGEFVAERQRRLGDETDPDLEVWAPSFMDPTSERGRRREELRASYVVLWSRVDLCVCHSLWCVPVYSWGFVWCVPLTDVRCLQHF